MKQNKKLRQGEELETGVPWFWLPLSLTQIEKVMDDKTLFTIIDYYGLSCYPPGQASFAINNI